MPAPDNDTIEISLIGPGFGEAIAVHLGSGEWILVDSCFDRDHKSASVSYLRSIGVDPATQVSNIIATHWHDDHIGGLAQAVDVCKSARFWCPDAMSKDQFINFVAVFAEADPSPVNRSTKEIVAILETLAARNAYPHFAKEDTLVRRIEGGPTVHTLSPSNQRVADFLARIAAEMPAIRDPRRWKSDLDPNLIAAAVTIDFGPLSILLGADLVETPGGAWSTLHAQSQALRGRIAAIFKIPHHGSETGHCAPIWDERVIPEPIAILTPYTRLVDPLPTAADVTRILSYTTKAYSSARVRSTAPQRRSTTVDRTLSEHGYKLRRAEPKPGQVRLRHIRGRDPTDWSVELLDNAVRLADIRS